MTTASARAASPIRFDIEATRRDFPALRQRVHGHDLVYLDSAASALKPQSVVDAIVGFYTRDSANVHRGVHLLSQRATLAYEGAREKARAFLNAREACEVAFVRGTTEAMNLVAQTYGKSRLGPGDEVLLTGLEHHSNIVPWQMVAEETGARLVIVPVTDSGDVEVDAVAERLTDRTKVVSIAHVSNTLGTVLPLEAVTDLAHRHDAVVVVDGAQAAPHLKLDVQALDVDFYAFSGHKAYGPTGIGVLYGRREIFETLPPYQGGGSMIHNVTFEKTTYRGLPDRYEAGTPHIAGAIGLGAALDYLASLDAPSLEAHEQDLLEYGTRRLAEVPGLRLIGTAPRKVPVLSFVMEGIHPHDIGTVVDAEGVAIRTGHHCTQPLMERFGVAATARASMGLYNRREDIDALVTALVKAHEVFR